tara:strand:- start:118 stop:321 length:204 start_codon:yes stop_codon:yes gene_type:complete
MKENDFLLGNFTTKHVDKLTNSQLVRLEALLDESDNDIYNWITGKEQVPANHDHDLMDWLRKFNNCL